MRIRKENLMNKKAGISYSEILILIISTFAFSYLIYSSTQVSALTEEEEEALRQEVQNRLWGTYSSTTEISTQAKIMNFEGFGCCEKTLDGNSCQFRPEGECDPEFNFAPTECQYVDFCRLGCCYDSEEGICATNSPQGSCIIGGGKWFDNAGCNINECKLGCCILGNEAKFTTEQRCAQLVSSYGLTLNFDKTINNELQCILFTQRDEEGACVTGEDCKFTTRESCEKMRGNFYREFLCSNPGLNTICQRQASTGCAEGRDGVYWFDSCGNVENVYDSNKEKSWNNGRVLYPAESCGTSSNEGNANSKTCGNCNYILGSICGLYRPGIDAKPNEGDYVCRSLSCEVEIYGNKVTKKNGESWCIYDGTIGNGKDVVGSRHIKHTCFNGEEIIEPCADYRNEICIQSETDLGNRETFTESACRINRWRECAEVNTETDEALKKEKCQKIDDCEIKDVNIDKYFKFSVCTPKYPPGFDLKNYPEDAQLVCAQASQKCTAVKVRTLSGWKWKANKHCTEAVFTEQMNEYCTSLGDCGGYVNYIGEYDKGFNVKGKAPNSLSSTIINRYKSYARPNAYQEPAAPGNLSWIIASMSGKDGGFQEADVKTGALIGGIIGGVGTYALTSLAYDLELVYFIGEKIPLIGKSITPSGGLARTGSSVSVAAHLGNVVAAGLGAAAGVYVAMRIAGKDMPGDAALVISVLSSIGGTVAGISAAGNVFSITTVLQGAFAAFVWAFIIALILIAIFELFGVGDTKKYVVEFQCLPWQAPTGGADCNKCNGDPFKPCSDYRCSSLGQTCEFINKGTEYETCIDTNPKDVSSPKITPLYETITEGYQYSDITGSGFKVLDLHKDCIPEYTQVEFGIETDKPAQCKVGTSPLQTYDEMVDYFGGNNFYLEEHKMILDMPSPAAFANQYNLTSSQIADLGKVDFYVKCKSYTGSVNEASFIIRSCVNPGPDLTAPYITLVNPPSGSYAKHDSTEKDIGLWTNEPANCKWDYDNREYKDMANQFNCETDIEDYSLYGWPCNTTLTGLNENNKFHIKCQDISENKNAMTESYVYILTVSKSGLQIDEISPRYGGEIISGVEPLTVNLEASTSGGAEAGKSACYYKFSEDRDYIRFLNTYSDYHKQVFSSIMSGNYKIYVKCEDVAENAAENFTEFRVSVDTSSPVITRVYYEGDLIVMTDENSKCAYSFTDTRCLFDIENETTSVLMTGEGKEHSADWQTESVYYIKCKDKYGNQPGGCNIVVRSYDLMSFAY